MLKLRLKKPDKTKKTFDERDLHKLLSSYLKNIGIYSKTIFHEQSNNRKITTKFGHILIWLVLSFLNLQQGSSQNFLKAINRVDTFKLSSYEIKKEINSDSELKKAFFQAVSNSSWANYGYLVAFEFSDSLNEEMERLNQSFGIGIIELMPIHIKARFFSSPYIVIWILRQLTNFAESIRNLKNLLSRSEKLMTAEEKYYNCNRKGI